jgi:hypothetical protein
MGLGFKGGFSAFMDGYNKAEQKNYDRTRQEKEDAWMQSQRDVKLAEQKRDEEFRAGMAKVNEDVDTSQPEVIGNNPSAYVAPTTSKRAALPQEVAERAAKVYGAKGDITNQFAMVDAAKKLDMADSAKLFSQFRSGASGLPIEKQIEAATQIFNNDARAGHIDNVRYAKDGSVTFDATNKSTGKTITKTFSDPAKLMDDFHAYYSQGSWDKEVTDRREQAQKIDSERTKPREIAPGGQIWSDGKLIAENENATSADARLQGFAMGAGLGGGSGRAGKPVAPKFVKTKNDEGVEVFMDENSGAQQEVVPGTPGVKGNKNTIIPNWLMPEREDQPEVPMKKVWKLPDGTVLPNGPQELYDQLPVNKKRIAVGGVGGAAKPSASAPLPAGLVVGASTKQADGTYSAQGKQVTIKNGKITGIK